MHYRLEGVEGRVTAMLSVQLGAALSVGLFPAVGAAGTAWLRLLAGAVILLAIARPRPSDVPRAVVPAILGLGVATAVMNVAFLAALQRIPLGTTVPGSADRGRSPSARAAHAGLASDGAGRGPAAHPTVAGPRRRPRRRVRRPGRLRLGVYILLTQHVGGQVAGVKGLALTIPIAALASTAVGLPQAAAGWSWSILAAAFGLAVLLPVLPFSLEMLALRRLTTTAFGTLMALEPAIAVTMGAILLHQTPNLAQALGAALVVTAGIGAERRGQRHRENQLLGTAELNVA